MKKIVLILLSFAAPAFAGIAVTPGVGKTVHTDTINSEEVQVIEIGTAGGTSTATVVAGALTVNDSSSVIRLQDQSGNGITSTTNALDINIKSGSTVLVSPAGAGSFTTTPGSGTQTTQGGLSDNGAASATNRIGDLPGISQSDYRNGTAATQGRDSSQSMGTDGLLWTANLPAMRPASYSASTGTLTTAASATDIAALCGNANNTVLVYGMRASCTQTTAGIVTIGIVKRSAAYTGAWSTVTASPQDSTYQAVQSSMTLFTANPGVGTLVGTIDAYRLGCMATGTATPNDIYISPSDWKMKPIVLRGATQCVGLSLGTTTITGGLFTVTFDWIETKTISP